MSRPSPAPHKVQGALQMTGWKECKCQLGKRGIKLCLLTTTWPSCVWTQWTRSPAYGQASQRSGMNQGEAYETPHLGEELVAVGHCWRDQESPFYGSVATSRLSVLHTRGCIDGTDWTQWVIKIQSNAGYELGREMAGRGARQVDMIKIYYK